MYYPRLTLPADRLRILDLYHAVSFVPGGLARTQEEITESYLSTQFHLSRRTGVCMVIDHPADPDQVIAEVHCIRPEPQVFHHILSDLTIAVHPAFQGKGVGRLLFEALQAYISRVRKDIMRVELITRESNQRAIRLYENLGFRAEGRFELRIRSAQDRFEADIPMVWFNPTFDPTAVWQED